MKAILFSLVLLPSLCFADYYVYDRCGRLWLIKTTPTPSYYTQNNTGTTYGTTNNYGTSYQTINNYGNAHTTVNNYGTGRTTVNDYGAGSVTTVNGSMPTVRGQDDPEWNARQAVIEARLDNIDRLLGINTKKP